MAPLELGSQLVGKPFPNLGADLSNSPDCGRGSISLHRMDPLGSLLSLVSETRETARLLNQSNIEVLQLARASRGHDLSGRSLLHREDNGQIAAGIRSIARLAGGEDHRHAE